MEAIHSTASCTDDSFVYEALRSADPRKVNRAASCLRDHQPGFRNYIFSKYYNGKSGRDEMEKDVEDIFQDAVIILINHVQQEPPRFRIKNIAFRSIRTYVFKCGEYLFLNRRNKSRRREEITNTFRPENSIDGIAEMLKREEQLKVRNAIAQLDDNCSQLLRQRFYEDREPREIAAERDEKANNISQQIIRCREKLKKVLMAEDII